MINFWFKDTQLFSSPKGFPIFEKALLIYRNDAINDSYITICSYWIHSVSRQPTFESIGDYPEAYTAENVLIRLISGLGYRYYWATKDLSERDINYRPSPEASSCSETLEHIYSLTQTTKNVIFDIPNVRPQEDSNMNHIQLREATLNTLHLAVEHLKTLDKGSIQKKKACNSQKREKLLLFPSGI